MASKNFDNGSDVNNLVKGIEDMEIKAEEEVVDTVEEGAKVAAGGEIEKVSLKMFKVLMFHE